MQKKPEKMRLPIEYASDKFYPLVFTPARYKVYYGGRGGGKSHAFGAGLLQRAMASKLRILCTREYQNSIADSVHRLLCDQIEKYKLSPWFEVTKTEIRSKIGSQFIFKGLARSIQEIKSLEGIDIAWIEEAQSTSDVSWEILIPTIRKKNSEIWVSFNPDQEDDPTYQRFVVNTPPGTLLYNVGWEDNQFFPDVLDRERQYMLEVDSEAYRHVWGGECRVISAAQVFRGRYEVEDFDSPGADERVYYGVDWGFSQDPTAVTRWFVRDNVLHVDCEAYGVGVELDDLDRLFDTVPGIREWPVMADNARPETISHMRRRGFDIYPAPKWAGSIEDGLSVMKSFEKILVHPRCRHAAEEFRLYSYRVDRLTGAVLPILVDKHNHIIDSGRYALSPLIRQKNFFDDAVLENTPPLEVACA